MLAMESSEQLAMPIGLVWVVGSRTLW